MMLLSANQLIEFYIANDARPFKERNKSRRSWSSVPSLDIISGTYTRVYPIRSPMSKEEMCVEGMQVKRQVMRMKRNLKAEAEVQEIKP